MLFTPIHEIAEGQNIRFIGSCGMVMMRNYLTSMSTTLLLVRKWLSMSGIIEKFCTVVGESFKSARNTDVMAPMDFAIVTGWQVRAK